ncbi:MAG: hypothetical protein RLZZ230_679 [Candidatus Parcubacteria bacterium]|jgi:cytoskeletal protein RodZ
MDTDQNSEKPSGEGFVSIITQKTAINLILAIFIVLILATAVYLTLQDKEQIPASSQDDSASYQTISSEQVSLERRDLTQYINSDSTSTTSDPAAVGTFELNSESDSATIVSVEESAKIVNEGDKTPVIQEPIVAKSTGTAIKMGQVTIVSKSTNSPLGSPQSVSGNTFFINIEENFFTIITKTGSVKILVNDDTRFKVGDNYFDIKDLKVADIVTVAGKSTSLSTDISADLVTLTGALEFIGSMN